MKYPQEKEVHGVHVLWGTPMNPQSYGPTPDEAPTVGETKRRVAPAPAQDNEKEEARQRLEAIQKQKQELESKLKNLASEDKTPAQDLGRDIGHEVGPGSYKHLTHHTKIEDEDKDIQ